jgi:hypothetical protein
MSRNGKRLDPNHKLPEDIRRLQDPNFTKADFYAALRKVAKVPPKGKPKR